MFRILDEGFGVAGERAAEHGFVDEINSEARGVLAHAVRNVVVELIFLLVAKDGKRGDGGDELIVAKGFEAGNGAARWN